MPKAQIFISRPNNFLLRRGSQFTLPETANQIDFAPIVNIGSQRDPEFELELEPAVVEVDYLLDLEESAGPTPPKLSSFQGPSIASLDSSCSQPSSSQTIALPTCPQTSDAPPKKKSRVEHKTFDFGGPAKREKSDWKELCSWMRFCKLRCAKDKVQTEGITLWSPPKGVSSLGAMWVGFGNSNGRL